MNLGEMIAERLKHCKFCVVDGEMNDPNFYGRVISNVADPDGRCTVTTRSDNAYLVATHEGAPFMSRLLGIVGIGDSVDAVMGEIKMDLA